VIFALAGMVLTASGQTSVTNILAQTDFDNDAGQGNADGDNYCWAWAGTDAGACFAGYVSQGIVAGAGVGGSSAYVAGPDYTDLATDPDWLDGVSWATAEFAMGVGFSPLITPMTNAPDWSTFIVSADLELTGLVPPSQWGANVYITKCQFLDTNNNVIFDFNGYGAWINDGSFAHLSVPLSWLSYAAVGNGNGGDAMNPITDITNAAVVSSIGAIVVEFEEKDLTGSNGVSSGSIGVGGNTYVPVFGDTATGTMVVDNVKVIQLVAPATPPPPPTPLAESPIMRGNFDTTFPTATYGFTDRDGANYATDVVSINPTDGIGGSACYECTVDISSWGTNPPASYSGFGGGANETLVQGTLTNSSQAYYRVYVSAKVDGLLSGITSIPASLDLSFFAPITNAGGVTVTEVYDLNASLTLSNTWQSFVFNGSAMQIPPWLSGAQGLFNNNVTDVNQIELQVSIDGSPDLGALFGYNDDLALEIDNINVVQLVPGLPSLTILQKNGQTQVQWADPDAAAGGTAQLQSATTVSGPYVNVAGASSAAKGSPYTVPPASPQRFFRTIWVQ
jgi:hypothetical protein